MNKKIEAGASKPRVSLLAHDVVVSDHNPSQSIEFYAARLREWWNCAGTLPALQLDNDDYLGTLAALETGNAKYSDRDWEQGAPYSVYMNAAMRHFLNRGQVADSGVPHRHHFLCCYMFLAAYTARGLHQFDDRPRVQRFFTKAEVEGTIRCDRVGVVFPYLDVEPPTAPERWGCFWTEKSILPNQRCTMECSEVFPSREAAQAAIDARVAGGFRQAGHSEPRRL